MNIQLLSSVIFVKDMPASRRFYENLLGRQVLMDHGPNVGYVGGLALWQVDHAHEIMFGRTCAADKLGQDNFELYFETSELEAVHTQMIQAGVPLVHPLIEQPWGQRVFRVYDPDGHIVEIGEPMDAVIARFLRQGLTVAQVAQRTSMPVEIVQQMADNTNH